MKALQWSKPLMLHTLQSFLCTCSRTFKLPQGLKCLRVTLIGAGGSAGAGHFHTPNIFNTYWGTGGTGGSGAYIRTVINMQDFPNIHDASIVVGNGVYAYGAKGGDTVFKAGDITLTAGGGTGGRDGQGDGGSDGYKGIGGVPTVQPETLAVDTVSNGNDGHTGIYPTGGGTQGVFPPGAGWDLEGTVYGTGGINGGYGNYNIMTGGAGHNGAALLEFLG